jgi:hypothetical protein
VRGRTFHPGKDQTGREKHHIHALLPKSFDQGQVPLDVGAPSGLIILSRFDHSTPPCTEKRGLERLRQSAIIRLIQIKSGTVALRSTGRPHFVVPPVLNRATSAPPSSPPLP